MGKTKQNNPRHRYSKPCLVYSSALISTFAKESYLLNSDPMLQTLNRTFLKVFFFNIFIIIIIIIIIFGHKRVGYDLVTKQQQYFF